MEILCQNCGQDFLRYNKNLDQIFCPKCNKSEPGCKTIIKKYYNYWLEKLENLDNEDLSFLAFSCQHSAWILIQIFEKDLFNDSFHLSMYEMLNHISNDIQDSKEIASNEENLKVNMLSLASLDQIHPDFNTPRLDNFFLSLFEEVSETLSFSSEIFELIKNNLIYLSIFSEILIHWNINRISDVPEVFLTEMNWTRHLIEQQQNLKLNLDIDKKKENQIILDFFS